MMAKNVLTLLLNKKENTKLIENLTKTLTDARNKKLNYCYLDLRGCQINESNFKVIIKLLASDPSFFKGIDLSFNPYFKDNSLKNLFILSKPTSTIEKCIDRIPTRFITFLSLEKTGVASEATLCGFANSVFTSCPDIEILILNSLPITDKVCVTMAVSIQNAVQSKLKLVRNLKEVGLSNTKITDRSSIKLMFALLKHTSVEVINLECNQGIGFNTASFILQQLCIFENQSKIKLREVFLEYTKVSTALRNSLDDALFSYHKGDLQNLNRISKQNNICVHGVNASRSSLENKSGRSGCSKCNSNNGQRSQPRQNSSRYAFANDFMILNEKESDISNTNRSKSIPRVNDIKDIEEIQIHIHDINDPLNHPVSLKVDTQFTNSTNKIDFSKNNHLFSSNSRKPPKNNFQQFKETFESLKKSRISLNALSKRQSIVIDSVNSTNKIDDSIMSVLSSSNAIERIKRNRSELVNYYYNLKQKERERSSYSNLDRTSINMSNASIKNFDRFADSKKTPSFSERQIIINPKQLGRIRKSEESEVESVSNLSQLIANNEHLLSNGIRSRDPGNTNRSNVESSKVSTSRSKQNFQDLEKHKYLNDFSSHSEYPSGSDEKSSKKGYEYSITHDPSNKENIGFGGINDINENPYKRLNKEISLQKKFLQGPFCKIINESFKEKVEESKADQNQSYLSGCESPNRSAILNYYSKNTFHYDYKDENEEDDEVRQMLNDAGMNTFQSIRSKHKYGEPIRFKREDSITSLKHPLGSFANNNSSLCLYGTESGVIPQTNLNLSNLNNIDDHMNSESKLEEIGETDRENFSPNEVK